MGEPAAVMGDTIVANCAIHMVPSPTGNPVPAPGLPFSAPLLQATAATVLLAGRPAAVAGSTGYNTPPHIGLYPADPFIVPNLQIGTVVVGSVSVLIEGRPAAKTGSTCTVCGGLPGTLVGTAVTVLVGG